MITGVVARRQRMLMRMLSPWVPNTSIWWMYTMSYWFSLMNLMKSLSLENTSTVAISPTFRQSDRIISDI